MMRFAATLPLDRADPTLSWNELTSAIHARPYGVDHRGRVQPDLVGTHHVSPDGLTHTMTARPGATWHDGAPVVAADLAASLTLAAEPSTRGTLPGRVDGVAGVELRGSEVRLQLGSPQPRLTHLLARVAVVPRHLVDDKEVRDGAMQDLLVGAGPYRVEESSQGRRLLRRHEGHHGPRARCTRVEMVHVADDGERARAVLAGAVDLAQVKPQHVHLLAGARDVDVARIPTRVWRALAFTLARPLVREAGVRRALAAMIDRDTLVAEALHGIGRPQPWPTTPGHWSTPPAPPPGVGPPTADLERAGWVRVAGRWHTGGAEVRLRLACLETEAVRIALTESIRRQWERHGIGVDVVAIGWQEYHRMDRHGVEEWPFDGIVVGWSAGTDPLAGLISRFATDGSYNRQGFSDPELDAALATASAAEDDAAALPHLHLAMQRAHEAAVMVPLVNPDYLFASRRGYALPPGTEVDSFYELTQHLPDVGPADPGATRPGRDTT
ncbi:ABC transporter substrate-binding protein [Litorihabitans aurantiacus]|nr:ABC transporter substrate-binding protein [Litorihabitans aurantiacus]